MTRHLGTDDTHPNPDPDPDPGILAKRGYIRTDSTVIRAAPLVTLAQGADPARSVIECMGRMSAMEAIWAAGGIGPARLAVMDRVVGTRGFLLGRAGDVPAAVAFLALHGSTAMLHALEVSPAYRGQGLGAAMMQAAAHWAARRGASHLALAVTEANTPANRLYERLGLPVITGYEYWQHPG